mmetsp:Transcript_2050/g.13289  ORF Transcript_2050/g.13289 Transcript_2050/m.13289 type:complete len:180 (-) Transcript_2050:1747-2286(-)
MGSVPPHSVSTAHWSAEQLPPILQNCPSGQLLRTAGVSCSAHATQVLPSQMGSVPPHSVSTAHWSAEQLPPILQNCPSGQLLRTAGVSCSAHATQVFSLLQMGAVPPHSVSTAHWSAEQLPPILQNCPSGQLLRTAGVSCSAHATQVLSSQMGAVPPHWASISHWSAEQLPSLLQNSSA